MPTALFLSPHLDDVVFSCGGTLARLSDLGWTTVLATAFTRSVVPATGFALACQLDKGLPPEVDYMAIRREEDRRAGAILGVRDVRWLDLLEAPHRGYASAAALFMPPHPDDDIRVPLGRVLHALIAATNPELVFAPQTLGGHVDHVQMRAALGEVGASDIVWYRDTPYASRDPVAAPPADLLGLDITVPIDATLERKLDASCEYVSQIGFQFGGAGATAEALRAFALDEGRGVPAERFRLARPMAMAVLTEGGA